MVFRFLSHSLELDMGFMKQYGISCFLVASLGLLCSSSPVLAEVQMKSREGQSRLANRTSPAKSRVARRSHLILDFAEAPTPATASRLAARGMRVVAYLPLTGVIVGVDGEANLEGLNLAGYDALQPEDKLSRELVLATSDYQPVESRTDRQSYYVLEFHGDIPWDERRALVTESGAWCATFRKNIRICRWR